MVLVFYCAFRPPQRRAGEQRQKNKNNREHPPRTLPFRISGRDALPCVRADRQAGPTGFVMMASTKVSKCPSRPNGNCLSKNIFTLHVFRFFEPLFSSPVKNVFSRGSRGNEAQIPLEIIIHSEPSRVGCYFFNGLLERLVNSSFWKNAEGTTGTFRYEVAHDTNRSGTHL